MFLGIRKNVVERIFQEDGFGSLYKLPHTVWLKGGSWGWGEEGLDYFSHAEARK